MGEAPRALALVGPTASGKTALSLDLAEAVGAEIISVDSRQVYRGMDVGTAKPTAAERGRVPHHGLDLVEPVESYSAGRFARDARGWIGAIERRGRVPLLVGGTGFFLRTLMQPIFREPPLDRGRLEALRERLDGWSREELERAVRLLDPHRLAVASEGGPQRLGRSVEIALLTGRPLSWWHEKAPAEGEPVSALVVVLDLPRELIDRRIEERIRGMLRRGLVEEVRELLGGGVPPDAPGMTGVGYREIVAHLEGRIPLEEAVDRIARATRRYARRQLTWFRNQLPESGVLRVDGTRPLPEIVRRIGEAWRLAVDRGLEAVGGPVGPTPPQGDSA